MSIFNFFRRNQNERSEPQRIQLPPLVIQGARAQAMNALLQGRGFLMIADGSDGAVLLTDSVQKKTVYNGIRTLAKMDKQALEALTDIVIDLNRAGTESKT